MTTNRHLPSVEALLDNDDDRLTAELRAREVREHVAVARTLLDAIEQLEPVSETRHTSLSEQAAKELATLGCKIVEVANALSRAQRNPMELHRSDEFCDVPA